MQNFSRAEKIAGMQRVVQIVEQLERNKIGALRGVTADKLSNALSGTLSGTTPNFLQEYIEYKRREKITRLTNATDVIAEMKKDLNYLLNGKR